MRAAAETPEASSHHPAFPLASLPSLRFTAGYSLNAQEK